MTGTYIGRGGMQNKKPNILIIGADQLAWRALSVYGGEGNTPAIDALCKEGVAFSSAYCTCPLCQPSRSSMWSGCYPHKTGVVSNGRNFPVDPVSLDIPTLGEVFKKAGYETFHMGKCHDAGALRGFSCEEEKELFVADEHASWPFNMDTYADAYTVEKATGFLGSYTWDKPLLMVADFVNPHNICGWIGKNANEHADVPIPPGYVLPPLPENFAFPDILNRPIPIQYICCSHIRQAQASQWTEENYRHYLAAYYYYLSCVDSQIKKVLDALRASGHWDDTLLVFYSDHGDNMTSRGMVTKQVSLYEESVHVPLVFSGYGVQHKGTVVPGLVSLLDLFPTLCCIAGIPIPKSCAGNDISAAVVSSQPIEREYVVSQWHTEWGFTISPGRMLRTDRYKYCIYLEGNGEELYDLVQDPGEMKNIANDLQYQSVLQSMRALFASYLRKEKDPFWDFSYKADKRWRSHAVGYQNHRGITAPQATDAKS